MAERFRVVVRDDCPPGSIYTSPDGEVLCPPNLERLARKVAAEHNARQARTAGNGMTHVATKTVERVESESDDTLLVHCTDGGVVEIEASGEQRRWWLEDHKPGSTFDVIREDAA